MKRLSALLPLLFSGVANAATLNSLDALGQAQFRLLSENLTAATHYKGVTPAEPLGILWLDVGVGLSSTGVGSVRSNTKPKGIAALSNETFNQTKTYVGLNTNLGVNLAFEADQTGDYTCYSAKGGIRF